MANVIPLRQSTAATLLLGPFLDETDGKTAETALTISQADVLLWKQGGTTLAQKNESTSATHRSNGLYTVPIDTTDTNTLGVLSVSVHEAGALPVRQDYTVLPAVVWDEMFDAGFAYGLRGISSYGTAQSATGTTVVLAAGESLADDVTIGQVLGVYGSTQAYWQFRVITDYVNSTDTATVDTWTVTPSGTITYVRFASPPADATNIPAVNVTKVAGTTQTGRDLGASVLISSGTGTGQLDVTSGVVKSNLAQILGTALTETAGLLAAGFKQFFNIASPTSTMNTITAVTTVNGLASNVITAAAINTGAITNAKFAAGAIDATAIATDAITAAKLAADAGAEIADAVWDEVLSGHTTAGTAGKGLIDSSSAGNPWSTDLVSGYTGTQAGNILNAVKAKTDQLAFSTANQVDAQVKSMAANTVTASAVATDAVTELQSGLATASALSTAQSDLTTIKGAVDTEVAAILAAVDTEVAAIKAKTDQLTFTVSNQVDANMQSINDATVTGNGVSPKFGV